MNGRRLLPLLAPTLVAAGLLPLAVILPFAGCGSVARPTLGGGTLDAAPPDAGGIVGVLEHHGSGMRAGVYVDPAFTRSAIDKV